MGIMDVFPLTLRLGLMTRMFAHEILFLHDLNVVLIGIIKLKSLAFRSPS